ncbi:hypothetical protein LTR53_013581 [Teratosphaeriaceae sp. CCFEE 6253]|nr:hypothetical protein LTR53_013581 [Teratosphaeriaceae sp. CCFEE 6253]
MSLRVDMGMRWEDQNIIKKDGEWTVDGRPTINVDVAWHETPSNALGKAFVGLKVTAPRNAATPPHTHGGSAVSATVIQGRVLNQMVCGAYTIGPKVYEKGESWYEAPGCHHVRSENVGDEEAVFIASMITDEKRIAEMGLLRALVVIDADLEGEAGKR